MNRLVSFLSEAMALLALYLSSSHAFAATIVVNSHLDPGTGGCTVSECTLREAITAANATTAADTINFSFPLVASPDLTPDAIVPEVLIQPTTALPTITQPVTINGYSVSGSAVNTDPVVSNAKLRIRIDGNLQGANSRGITVCANNVTIKGLSVTRFSQVGLNFGLSSTSACTSPITGANVHGNFFGLATNGSTDAGNLNGLEFRKATGNVGSSAIADRNVISANNASGIALSFVESSNTVIINNLIGTDKSGVLDRGNRNGINLSDVGNLTVGTLTAPNLIANSSEAGIKTQNTSFVTGNDNAFFANRFVDNGLLSIELEQFSGIVGVTPNDLNDADTGPNGLQNFPVITAASRISGGLHLTGTLDVPVTTGSVNYTLGMYASSSCDSSGHGEGELLLGSRVVGFRGNATEGFNFDHFTSVAIPFGSLITMTATGPDGTSEFSACFPIDPPPLVVNNTTDVADGVCNAAHCSLRDAIIAANSTPGADVIRFNITSPASGELLIQPTSVLPIITAPVTVDGYSQPGTSVNTDPEVSNAVLRVRIDGLNVVGGNNLIEICANDTTIRGLSITRMTNGSGNGIAVCSGLTSGVSIVGNFIGLASDGMTSVPNGDGILSNGRVTVGGIAAADRNVIGDNNSTGITLQSSSAPAVFGNLIGTDKSGLLNRGQGQGIFLSAGVQNAQIGAASAPNLIRFNGYGIRTNGATSISGNSWTQNQIFDSLVVGIDLGVNNVTLNDANDADTGPNGLQNFPVITKAERNATGIAIGGTLDVPVGTSNVPYTVGVYANAACDSSGHGEGQFLLGTATVNLTQTSGENFNFVLDTEVDLVANAQITTIATGPEGSSEFSACVAATDAPPGIVVDSTLDVGTTAGGCTVTGDANECTLREAITLANTQVGADLIRFELPGSGPFQILPTTLLPPINEALTIDGFSQQGASPNAAAAGSDAVIQIELRDGGSLAFGLMTCSSDVTIQGLSITFFNVAAIATQMNSSASCAVVGNNVRIVGNYLGARPDGGGASNAAGILVINTVVNIGGPALADRNLISNNTGAGVRISGAASSGSRVENNLIGVNEDPSVDFGNGGTGVEINSASNVTIGGDLLGNVIGFNGRGVLMLGAGTGNTANANDYFRNDALGIDLSAGAGADGVTANDINDVDVGPNNLQNFPVLSDGSATPSSITLNGTLDVPPGISAPQAYLLSFYESPSCDGSNGEGEIYLGSQSVNLSSSAENFSVVLNTPPTSSATVITATATDPAGNTSEFSNCLTGPRPEPLFADSFE